MYTQVMKSKRGGAEEAPEEIEEDKFKRSGESKSS